MTLRNVAIIAMAAIAGYVGGSFSTQHNVEASAPPVVRATKFELVNASGAPVARWEIDSQSEAHLSFLDNNGVVVADFGVANGERPFIRMRGRDGKERIAMALDLADKPALVMGDEHWEGRVRLGFYSPDYFPYGDWDNWGLSFRTAHGGRAASIGMAKKPDGESHGFLTMSGKPIY